MNGAASDLSAIARAVVSFRILLAPLALTGLAIANTGLGRSRSASHAMLSALCVLGVVLAWFICGFSWQGYPGRPFHAIAAAGAQWNWIAAEPFFFRGLPLDGSPAALAAWLQIFSVWNRCSARSRRSWASASSIRMRRAACARHGRYGP